MTAKEFREAYNVRPSGLYTACVIIGAVIFIALSALGLLACFRG